MKAFITALAVSLMFAVGSASAGMGGGDGEHSNCSKSKWEDT